MIPAAASGAPDPGPPSSFFQLYNIPLDPARESWPLHSISHRQRSSKSLIVKPWQKSNCSPKIPDAQKSPELLG